MTKITLVIWLAWGQQVAPPAKIDGFKTIEACEKAADTVKKRFKKETYYKLVMVCLPS